MAMGILDFFRRGVEKATVEKLNRILKKLPQEEILSLERKYLRYGKKYAKDIVLADLSRRVPGLGKKETDLLYRMLKGEQIKVRERGRAARKMLGNLFSGAKRIGVSALGVEIPNIMLVLALFGVAAVDFAVKMACGFEPVRSGTMSVLTCVLFLWITRGYRLTGFLLGALAFDLLSPLFLRLTTFGYSYILFARMYLWFFIAFILFIKTTIDYLNRGLRIPFVAKIVFAAIVIALIVIGWPFLANYYKETVTHYKSEHSEAFAQAKQIEAKVKEKAKEHWNATKRFYARWLDALKSLMAGDVEGFQKKINPPPESGSVEEKKIEHTVVELIPVKQYKKRFYEGNVQPVPIKLHVKTVDDEKLKISIECWFEPVSGGEKIEGMVGPPPYYNVYEVKGERYLTLTCEPKDQSALKRGRYYVGFSAVVDGLKARTSLVRIFAGQGRWTKEDEYLSLFGLSSIERSKSASEFAALAIDFGNEITHPLIDDAEKQPLILHLVNVGDGKIVKVSSIKVESDMFEDGVSDIECRNSAFDGNSLIFMRPAELKGVSNLKKGEKIVIDYCYVTISDALRKTEVPKKRLLLGTVEYDYRIEKKLDLEILKAD